MRHCIKILENENIFLLQWLKNWKSIKILFLLEHDIIPIKNTVHMGNHRDMKMNMSLFYLLVFSLLSIFLSMLISTGGCRSMLHSCRQLYEMHRHKITKNENTLTFSHFCLYYFCLLQSRSPWSLSVKIYGSSSYLVSKQNSMLSIAFKAWNHY